MAELQVLTEPECSQVPLLVLAEDILAVILGGQEGPLITSLERWLCQGLQGLNCKSKPTVTSDHSASAGEEAKQA